ncbi:MAG: hypothetical protein KatS3mg061_1364 [Dehalococcoidia bacterium]|nr:MAG: hypothetical protein KatS3mg061_1364 [Dehalococcoidia bacterium]
MLAIFSVALVLEFATFSHLAAFIPLYLEQELRLSAAEVTLWTGLASGLPLALALVLAPFWGVWAERYSPKLIIVRAQVFELVVYLTLVAVTSLPQFLVAVLLLGLTYGNIAVLMAVVAQITPSQRIGFAISIVQAVVPLGQSLGPLAGSLLIPLLGLRGLFALDAVLVALAAGMILLGIRDPRAPAPPAERAPAPEPHPAPGGPAPDDALDLPHHVPLVDRLHRRPAVYPRLARPSTTPARRLPA